MNVYNSKTLEDMTDFISEVNPVTNSAKGNLMMLSELKIPEAEMWDMMKNG